METELGRSSLLQPAAHLQAELGRDSPPLGRTSHLYKEGQGCPSKPTPCTLQTLALSRRRHHLLLLPPPRENPSHRLGLPQALAVGLALSPWCV